METEVFERELAMCQELSQKNGGKCAWGECNTCGVIPLLYKLEKGELYEAESAVAELKSSVLKYDDNG